MEVTTTVPPMTEDFPHLRPAVSAWPRSAPAAPRCAAPPAGRRCSRSPPHCLDGNNNGDQDGDLQISSLWIYMDLYGFIWIYMDLYGFIWIYMDLYKFIWIYMDLYGFIWIYMDLDCLVWIANQDLVFVSFSCYPKP